VVAVLAALAAIALLTLDDQSTQVDVSYEGLVGTEPGEPGVYRYDTVGFESVDALAGARHDYPAVTAMIVEERPCGTVVRWEPLGQRRDEWWYCRPGPSVDTIVEFHEWFGIGDTTETSCEGLHLEPRGEGRWEASCVRPGTVIAITLEDLGPERLVVGSEEVLTAHVRMVETTSGRTSGTRTTDLWVVPGTPLLARKQVVDRSTSSSPIGAVGYVEEYTLMLRSLTPSS
jgi:hypothetical protein